MSRSVRSGSVRATSQHPDQDTVSPPRTPPGPSGYKIKKGRHPRPSVRETFLDDLNDNANDSYDSGDERDPHDLSLSPNHAARTSIVDNMLLSLDQFSSGTSVLDDYRLFHSAFESPRYTRASQDSMAQRRYRGHTFSSSLSSDVEYGYDEGASRYAAQHARGRRSNSSSNYRPGGRRFESTRRSDETGSFDQGYDFRASATAPATRAGRKSSKGSTSSNIDFGPALSKRQFEPESERRSSSFDLGMRKQFMTFPGSTPEYDSMAYDGMDAAPTPSVPAGPRKYQPASQEFGGTLKTQSSRTPLASRRNSVKSSRTTQSRKPRPENLGTAAMKTRDHDFAVLADSELEPPPNISASLDPPAPSPTISFNKPTFPPPPEPTPNKERPGFFRRVFGSSKSPGIMPSESSPSDCPPPKEPELKEINTGSPSVRTRKPPQKPVTNDTHPPRQGAQVVNKKSSFFRRRKKSVAENIPPPIVLPQNLGPKASATMKPEPSPVSSLRKVMNPYLADAPPNNSNPAVDYSTESSDWSTAANDPDNKKPADAQTRKEKGNSLNVHNGTRAKYSLYPAPSVAQAHDTSFLGASSGDEEPVVKSNGAAVTPPVPPRSSRRPAKNDSESEDSDAKIVEMKPVAETSRDKLTLEIHRPTSLSPVAERSSLKSTVPAIETPEMGAASSTTKEAQEKDVCDKTIWNADSDAPSKLSTPVFGKDSPQPSVSEASNYQTASNTPIVPQGPEWKSTGENTEPPVDAAPESPTSEEKQQAQKLYDGQDEYVGNEPAAAWLGNPDRAKLRAAYMELFDWSNMNILAALRSLCLKLMLKGETQQVDRVLDAFSTRWCQCNPRHGFKAADVVHTICYSLLLLNTDLHLADIESKMTKAQFVRNTIPTIQRVARDAAPDDFGNKASASNLDSGLPSSRSATFPAEVSESNTDKPDKPMNAPGKLVNRLSRTDLGAKMASDADNEVGPLVSTPFYGTSKAWEQQVETVLRDFYSSIQKQRLPLLGHQPEKDLPRTASSVLLGPNPPGLRRTPSTVSKSGSDIFPRGRSADSRFGAARWSSKPRSRARLYPPSTLGSSRTSLDDQSSLWSPSGSSTWSKYSLGKLTSASVDSFGSGYPHADYQQSIGFANALSQAIIREDSAQSIASTEDPERTGQLLEDETLELAGAPWAKEGSLKHKHHLDSVDKRAKDRNWNECFAVIQQGWMRLFSFKPSKSMRQKGKGRHVVVGGGNWTENAEEIWKFLLRQSIASALPPPGYSKSRPHVWALSLPTGAVHLFQAGTPEIVKEFVSSANYWSARLSKEPLIGGVSNIEYGWSDAVINSALINSNSDRSPPSSSGPGPRPSIQSSIRSSIDQQVVRPKLPADRVNISDWTPPQQSMMAANHPEADQLKSLQTYVKNVEDELQRHNELRSAMVLAFSPRHPNAAKAMANWERKSSYLLREIVKFRTYIDSLQNAIDAKSKIFADRDDEPTPSESQPQASESNDIKS